MILYINTIKDPFVVVELRDGNSVLGCDKFEAKYRQAETLLPAIDRLLKDNKFTLSDIDKILVENQGGTFSSLRVGVVTANALGFALGVPVIGVFGEQCGDLVVPCYNSEPNIT